MGVYLSEPNRDKKVNEGFNKGLSFCAVEMQGTIMLSQGGEKTCKTPTSVYSTSVMAIRFSPSLMDTEVRSI